MTRRIGTRRIGTCMIGALALSLAAIGATPSIAATGAAQTAAPAAGVMTEEQIRGVLADLGYAEIQGLNYQPATDLYAAFARSRGGRQVRVSLDAVTGALFYVDDFRSRIDCLVRFKLAERRPCPLN